MDWCGDEMTTYVASQVADVTQNLSFTIRNAHPRCATRRSHRF